jgi:hypothetical protein
MATAEHGTKSQAISGYLATNPGAGINQIVEGLKEQGIQVSLGLAKVVKYAKKGKRSSSRKARKTAAAIGKPVSGSELIRPFIARHPAAMPKAIELGLKQQGVNVSLGLISNVKYGSRKKSGKRRSLRTPATRIAARKTPSRSVTVEQLLEVKRVADSLGGVVHVRAALDTLEQLR